jgi:hypothetical protein
VSADRQRDRKLRAAKVLAEVQGQLWEPENGECSLLGAPTKQQQ